MIRARGMTQFSQRLRFDLSNSLTGHVELFADFLKGVIGIHVDTKSHAQHLRFSGSETTEHVLSGFPETLIDGGIHRCCLLYTSPSPRD